MTASKKILMGYYENEIKVLEEDGFAQFYSNGSLMFTKSISYKNEEFTIDYIPSYIFGSKRTVSITEITLKNLQVKILVNQKALLFLIKKT
jgi:hypothetical protein